MDEEQMLRDRLHRVALALTVTEERVADTLEALADSAGAGAEDYRLNAKRARAAATECRAFALRLGVALQGEAGF
jgi:hypothetical protein